MKEQISQLAIGFCLSWAIAANLEAQDRVTLQKPGKKGRVVVEGQVIDFNSQEIEVKPADGGELQRFAANQVVSVEAEQSGSHTAGLELFQKGEFERAQESLELALKTEKRSWLRKEILAQLVRCATAMGNEATAVTRFLALEKSSPQSGHFGVIPLRWDFAPVDTQLKKQARDWLNGQTEVAQLIGASFLLRDSEGGQGAQQTLRNLARKAPIAVQSLARWQLRREDAFAGKLGVSELAIWERSFSQLPRELQAGPAYLLGEAFSRQHEHQVAAAYWLMLPFENPGDVQLAARSGTFAGKAIAKAGHPDEARTVFHDICNRFPQTDGAIAAAKQLQSPQTQSAATTANPGRGMKPRTSTSPGKE